MTADRQAGILLTDPEKAARVGKEAVAPETVWLLQREAIAARYHTDPVTIEAWPAYERRVALHWLTIESEAEKRKTRRNR
jgi:hypothetical protein